MSPAASALRALPVNPHTLAQRVERKLRGYRPGQGDTEPVLLVSAEPSWPYDPILTVTDTLRVRVVRGVSALAIWAELAQPHDLPTVILTHLSEDELGVGILSRVHRRRIIEMEPWSLVAEAFGAQRLDPRLKELPWAGRALVEATPPGGWPRLPGIVLHRDTALRHLAVQRLQLARLGTAAEDLDPATLLRWSALSVAPQALGALAESERTGLLDWLAEQFGPTMRLLAALYDVGRVTDTLPLGLVCAAIWAGDDPDSLRAQGRVEQYLGGVVLDAETVASFTAAATRTMAGLLADAVARDRNAERDTAAHREREELDPRRLGYAVLDRAEELLIGFAATGAARHSDLLRSGFEHRLGEVARALGRAVTDGGGVVTDELPAVGRAVAHLAAHHLAAHYPHRVERARMALRLVRWLAEPVEPPLGVAEGIVRQVTQWSWVDLALDHVWTGEDSHTALAAMYRVIHDRAQARRRDLDQAFATRLAAWTAAGGRTGDLLAVEHVLDRVVAPVVREGSRPVLVVVVDGMTTAIAVDLAEQLTRQGWLEYDPLACRPGRRTEARRRGVVAALPTVTAVSRTSLLTGRLCRGGQAEERAAFETSPLWQGRPAKLFHKGTLRGEAGEVLSEQVIQALTDPETVVGVVVNTVDDALRHGRESADAGWRLDNLGALRALLDYARYQGRAVIITSDHGHVLDRENTLRQVTDPASARHRVDPAPAGDGEVELTGARVLADGGRVVALWDPHLRYLPRQAGYHGGASLAEVTVPLLALLPLGAAPPPGWRLLGPQQPRWWSTSVEPEPADGAAGEDGPAQVPPQPVRARGATRRRSAPSAGPGLFELPAEAATPPVGPPSARRAPAGDTPAEPPSAGARPATPPSDGTPPAAKPGNLVDDLLASEMFKAQHELTPRRVPVSKIRGALTALLEANGVLPTALVAEKAGEQPARATGFVTTLQRIFNVDNFPVLSLVDDGRTVRLDLALLREQFQLPAPPPPRRHP